MSIRVISVVVSATLLSTAAGLVGLPRMARAQSAEASLAANNERRSARVSNQDADSLEEVTVTATRRSESIQKVPISMTAMTQDQMDTLGVKQFDDLVKYTPGLSVTEGQGGGNNVAIRGIISMAGASTTGIYIDDTPLQARNTGYDPGSAFPALFDLERVEVLRGPQGTLFGSGSEGGTVRFILSQPDLQKFTTSARFEGNHIQGGGNGGEAGASLSGPIIQDRLGFLVSAYFTKQAGYINAVTGTFNILDPTGASGPSSVAFTKQANVYPNANWSTTSSVRFALKFQPVDGLTLSPSILYQARYLNNSDPSFFAAASDPSSDQYNFVAYSGGNPSTNSRLTQQWGPNLEQSRERFILPGVNVTWDLGPVSLSYNGSYFKRDQSGWRDYTILYELLYGSPVPVPGDKSNGYLPLEQRNLVQELRLQSNDTASRLTWVVGAYFSRNAQSTNDLIGTNFLANLSPFTLFGAPGGGVAGGSPFGPGSTGFENFWGAPLSSPYSISFTDQFDTVDKQAAGFAQFDFKLTDQLTLTGGVRYSRFKLDLNAQYGGGENNLNPTFAEPCPSSSCVPGVFPPPAYATTNTRTSGSATTPKLGLTYQINADDMIYATVSKGFRPAGADLLAPVSACAGDLAQIGLLNSDGTSRQQSVYKPDYVWSYEVGSKDRLFNGLITLDTSLYQINWSNIQTAVALPICGYSVTLNSGQVRSQGVDSSLTLRPNEHLSIAASFGWNKLVFSEDSLTPAGTVLFAKGTGVPGAGSPITYSLAADYQFSVLPQWRPYVHADFSWQSALRRAGLTSPLSAEYNPIDVTPGSWEQTNLRAGMHLSGGKIDASLFVNNVTDEHPSLGLAYLSAPYYWLNSTLQPRTYGLTLAYHL